MMDERKLSDRYFVRRLTPADAETVYELYAGNTFFYRYHPPLPTKASVLSDMEALPPGTTQSDKHYLGFFDEENLIAVMDLITGYPSKNTAFIGLFMMRAELQERGIGSGILSDCMTYLKGCGFTRIRLGVDRGNPQSFHFWSKNGFAVDAASKGEYIVMEKEAGSGL